MNEQFEFQTQSQFCEGECTLKSIGTLQLNVFKTMICFILSVVTGGLFGLFLYWDNKLKLKLVYQFCSMEQATKFFVMSWDNGCDIVDQITVQVKLGDSNWVKKIGFISRFMKYYFLEDKCVFKAVKYDCQKALENLDLRNIQQIAIAEPQEYQYLKACFGKCQIEIPIPSAMDLFIQQILHPFFVFQVFSVALWSYEQYYIFAGIIFVLSMFSALINLFTTRNNIIQLHRMAFNSVDLAVKRKDCDLKMINSSELVPGDILYLHEELKLPCDCVLLQGCVLVNESSLTGESVPVLKNAFNPFEPYDDRRDQNNTLFEGTNILQIKKSSNEKSHQAPRAAAIVIRTSFSTLRGQMMRGILYPKPNQFRFFIQSLKYIGLLGFLTLIGYFILLPQVINIWTTEDIIIKLLDLVTITIPPALPAAMQVGITFAMNRLKKQNIFCISPPQVIVGGRVDLVAFDKTGTLTQQGMEMKGFIPINNSIIFDRMIPQTRPLVVLNTTDIQQEVDLQRALDCMVCCHSLAQYDKVPIIAKKERVDTFLSTSSANSSFHDSQHYPGSGDSWSNSISSNRDRSNSVVEDGIIGDPMELKLFKFTQGQFMDISEKEENQEKVVLQVKRNLQLDSFYDNEGTDYDEVFKVVQRYQFQSELQRMSVIAKSSQNRTFVFVQGAPQAVSSLCKKESIPENFSLILDTYAKQGLRILSIAYLQLKNDVDIVAGKRQDFETNLRLCGLALFENSVQVDTPDVISQLHEARIDTIIVTGDNALTAIAVGRESEILNANEPVILVDFKLDDRKIISALIGISEEEKDQENLNNDLNNDNDNQFKISDAVAARRNTRIQERKMRQGSLDPIELRLSNRKDVELTSVTTPTSNKSGFPRTVQSEMGNKRHAVAEDTKEKENQESKALEQLRSSRANSLPVQQRYTTIDGVQIFQWNEEGELQTSRNAGLLDMSAIENQFDPHRNSNDPFNLSSSYSNSISNQSSPMQKAISAKDQLQNEIEQYKRKYTIACSGQAFEELFIQNHDPEDKEMLEILNRTKIFARMKPNHQTALIERFQESGQIVAMVGDGANDCGALQQADVGLSLSQAEASISAPFTSQDLSIMSIIDLLKETRAGLSTSFQCFKFMALYSLIQFSTTLVLYNYLAMMADMQYLFGDLFIISSLFVTMSMTDSADYLSIVQPPVNLFGHQCLISTLGVGGIQIATQIFALQALEQDPDYYGRDFNKIYYDENEEMNKESQEGTTLFIVTNFIYLGVILAFSIGKPFRQPFYTNIFFTMNLLILEAYFILIVFFPDTRMPGFDFNPGLSRDWLIQVMVLGHISLGIIYAYEQIFCNLLYKRYLKQIIFQSQSKEGDDGD